MKSAVIIPTYNEKSNIGRLIDRLMGLNIGAYIIIVDDDSPDGTGESIRKLTEKYQKVKTIHRKKRIGLGAAYVDGLKYALNLGAERIITMDADFSHNPKDVPRLLRASEKYDIVIGSRYIKGGGTVRWEIWRRLLSGLGVHVSRLVLGLKIKDCTSGFKCYSRRFLESVDFSTLSSQGYGFNVKIVLMAQNQGFSILEIPILFRRRERGKSKLGFKEILRYIQEIFKIVVLPHPKRQYKKKKTHD